MKLLFKFIAFSMLALWLPATQHCDLEAAGFEILAHGAEHSSATCSDICPEDSCPVIEGVSFAKTCSHLRALPPSLTLHACLLGWLLAPTLVEVAPVVQPRDPPELQALHRTWSFARRTALPVRAPSFTA